MFKIVISFQLNINHKSLIFSKLEPVISLPIIRFFSTDSWKFYVLGMAQIYVPKCFNKLTSLRFYSINYILICALFFDCLLPSGISSDWVEMLQVILLQYTECFKKVETSEYLGKYKFYRKMLQTKVVGFKKIYLYWSYFLIISLTLGDVAKVRPRSYRVF